MRLWLLSQSAFSSFLSVERRSNHLNPDLFCIGATNVRSDILICLPFPQRRDDPILNKKPQGAYPIKELPAHIWLFTIYIYAGWGWRGKLLLMRGELTKAESELCYALLCMEAAEGEPLSA